jgi:hypothetical protein
MSRRPRFKNATRCSTNIVVVNSSWISPMKLKKHVTDSEVIEK